jgi:hypothetical protein
LLVPCSLTLPLPELPRGALDGVTRACTLPPFLAESLYPGDCRGINHEAACQSLGLQWAGGHRAGAATGPQPRIRPTAQSRGELLLGLCHLDRQSRLRPELNPGREDHLPKPTHRSSTHSRQTQTTKRDSERGWSRCKKLGLDYTGQLQRTKVCALWSLMDIEDQDKG